MTELENDTNENMSNPEGKKASIHTLESDLASAVLDKNYGNNIIKIITDHSKKTSLSTDSEKKENGFIIFFTKKNVFILLFILFIIISTSVILYILYKAKNLDENNINLNENTLTETQSSSTVDQISNNKPLLKNNGNILNPEIIQSADFTKLDKFGIISEIDKIKKTLADKEISADNIIEINTNLKIVELFEKIKYSGDSSLTRSFDDIYAFGLYSKDNFKFDTYLLIKIDNFDLAFKHILNWEKYMPIDLKDIFIGNNEIIDLNNTNKTESTTTIDKKYSKSDTKVFLDKILKNYDIREFVDNEKGVDIIYGFINNKYLLITSGETSFIDIKNRLLKEAIQR